ncbi:hypothetical protein PHYBOEH_011733 [Phytophthora boehmeriae]|uniref:Uncharacterized protein n=1 Tax=Phytophthora boehmeriae TaxID=109152 RepID=A0A8T1X2G0_9STRA|nr:hypothetical protein PHYBOEH_011733 [Phytophthora boehmeriae]
MVEEYRYRLQKAGPSTPAESQKNSWIQEFDESKATDVMSYLKNRSFELPLTTKLSFGQLCVKLISQRSKSLSSLTWPDLQKLQNLGDITTRWNNNCDRSSPAMAALLDDLEASKGPDDIPQIGLWVHFGNKQQDSWDLTLHLVDGKWKLHKAFTRRIVRGTYDIIHDDDISFRLRAVTREKLLDNDADNIQRHIDISIPGDSNFYDTIVTMAGSAPRGMFVKSAEIRSKQQILEALLLWAWVLQES